MARRKSLRVASAVFGGLAVGMALLAGLIIVNSGRGFAGCTATTAVGWMLPIMSGLVVGAAAWLLLYEDDEPRPEEGARTALCHECARPLAAEWRLCPYCGAMTQSAQAVPPVPPMPRVDAHAEQSFPG